MSSRANNNNDGSRRNNRRSRRSSRESRPTESVPRRYLGFPRPVIVQVANEDTMGVFLGQRYPVFSRVMVPGQNKEDRFAMVSKLRKFGLLDTKEYTSIKNFMLSLPHLHARNDLLFFMDIRVYNFLVEGWMRDGNYDFLLSARIYDGILEKLSANRYAVVPHRQTHYGRDLVDTVAEW